MFPTSPAHTHTQYDSGDSTEADDEASDGDGGVDPSVSSSEFLESLEDAGELLGDALLVPGGEQGFAYQGENIMSECAATRDCLVLLLCQGGPVAQW